ncbi:1-deoxy-D-xylulose 5-phosphate reductoisomerase [Endomicrobiia bacterium]|uniref:1-deoxy-D-xylulose 5-phosphate reductoisomerase n=1 Tax=Endomicrobium trichonymphae TaxID=1408204 RepID=DXR_ENDTX|nr:1-deoxy-D-xylulose-5-phosphate reductoisomerase [Candidatus Endomicrobium trichonymphae]B1H060.1 RecName: Full=1-deoxy-D-xylulose 5-phosphate reductoisomerase; Short=DXP reductoisomerase; AltName: Full=1-deoxyxylulose-5-phosphate reductoisomerase; AltName: Full=2-C-methyl-D-erythritol 4-phosphate synthase [Candidatus Endomicrobium trichonymphae]GHT03861.1 1-deoxy-D-xylulose 5-phosphate reductoisomerase [Endomicrobiia bacterium]BAG13892.1 1-deoxy-D-xylulose 5-phosphate reductoisomerase [Candid
MKRITILGSSGSIGKQTLNIISKMKENVCIEGLAVGSNIKILKSQIKKFKPASVSVNSPAEAQNLKKWCISNNIKTDVYKGNTGLEKLTTMPKTDMILAAIIGAVGLKSIIAAIKAKKDIAIANKEAIVMAGSYIMKLAAENGVSVLPVDSEHSAIFQCCTDEKKSQIKRIILTASGGPFYKYDKDFSKITVEQALDHPTWKMGRKITVDSATLMNKGLEAIEASVLFGVSIDKVEIIIHPQSVVHSMVEYVDGSVIAQLSNPDMKLPIQYALTYPERLPSNIKPLNLIEINKLEFYNPDFNKFPCLSLAYYAAQKGYTVPAVMNAANEMAVASFLNKEIKFTDIAKIVGRTIKTHKISKSTSLDTFIEADYWARHYAEKLINEI